MVVLFAKTIYLYIEQYSIPSSKEILKPRILSRIVSLVIITLLAIPDVIHGIFAGFDFWGVLIFDKISKSIMRSIVTAKTKVQIIPSI